MAGKKVTKQTKKFTKNHLSHTIKSRRKQQSKKKEIEGRKQARSIKSGRASQSQSSHGPSASNPNDDDNDDEADDGDNHLPESGSRCLTFLAGQVISRQ